LTFDCGEHSGQAVTMAERGQEILQHVPDVLPEWIRGGGRGTACQRLEYEQYVPRREPLRVVCGIRTFDEPLQRGIHANERVRRGFRGGVAQGTEIWQFERRGELARAAKTHAVAAQPAHFGAQHLCGNQCLEAAAHEFERHRRAGSERDGGVKQNSTGREIDQRDLASGPEPGGSNPFEISNVPARVLTPFEHERGRLDFFF
jgi:hypothetical protein